MIKKITRTYMAMKPYEKTEELWETENGKLFTSIEAAEKYEKDNAAMLRFRKLPMACYETKLPEYFDSWVKLETQGDIDYVLTFKNVKVYGNLYPGVLISLDHEDPDDYTPEWNTVYTYEHVQNEIEKLFNKVNELNG